MSEEYYEIVIDLGDEKPDLLSELKSLKKPEKEKENKEPLLLSNIKTKKKKDKKEKNKKSFNLDSFELMVNGEIESMSSFIDKKEIEEDDSIDIDDFVSLDELIEEREEEERNQTEELLDVQCSNYSNLKKESNPYKKEFAEEITLLYNLLKETNKFSKELEEQYRYISNSRTKGTVGKYTIDLANTINSVNSNKIQIIREINNVKKTIQDLKLKSDKNKDEKGNNSDAFFANQYFKNLINYGRSRFIKEFEAPQDDEDGIDTRNFINPDSISDYEANKYMDMIEERLENSDFKLRSEEADKYIEYENMGVQIKIKRCIDTNEWEFIAVDRHNQQIFGYPLPTKKSVGTIKFSSDGSYATDDLGRTYSVVEYELQDGN